MVVEETFEQTFKQTFKTMTAVGWT